MTSERAAAERAELATVSMYAPPTGESDADSCCLHQAGTVIGDYRLVRRIGEGGMGEVWEAEQVSLGRAVALKLILGGGVGTDAAVFFEREGRAGARLRHPSIVAVLDAGEADGVHFIAQELVRGGCTLKDTLLQWRSAPRTGRDHHEVLARFFLGIAEGLEDAHRHAVIHRDIKPGNILVTPEGTPKITDFGLARLMDEQCLSHTGDFSGTYCYASPEQIVAGRVGIDHRTDLFSFGVVLYEALTHQRPFEGDSWAQIAEKVMWEEPADVRSVRSQVPEELAVICARCVEKRPEDRFASMGEVVAELERFLRDEPILSRPAGPILRARKWARRHPAITTAVGLLAATFVVVSFLLGLNVRTAHALERASGDLRDARSRQLARNAQLSAKNQELREEIARRQRLSDREVFRDLQQGAKHLWPSRRDKVPELDAWLGTAAELVSRLPEHRADLELIAAASRPGGEADLESASPRPLDAALRSAGLAHDHELVRARIQRITRWRAGSELDESEALWLEGIDDSVLADRLEADRQQLEQWEAQARAAVPRRFEDVDLRFRYQIQSELVRELSALDAADGQIAEVRRRRERAMSLRRETLEDHAAEWDAATREVRDRFGIELRPQEGLVPLGPAPESGLWEFWHVETGSRPERDESGRWRVDADTGVVLVLVPGGTFWMGARSFPPSAMGFDAYAQGGEDHHQVTLSPWFHSKYELTEAQYARLNADQAPIPGEFGTLPVGQVSWRDLRRALLRVGLDLPTEAQWECAVRAGGHSPFWHGRTPGSALTEDGIAENFIDRGSYVRSPEWAGTSNAEDWDDGYNDRAPVGTFLPNPYGLYDTLGNLQEWCRDVAGTYAVGHRPGDGLLLHLPHPPPVSRAKRGGSCLDPAIFGRSAARHFWREDLALGFAGCRPARRLDE